MHHRRFRSQVGRSSFFPLASAMLVAGLLVQGQAAGADSVRLEPLVVTPSRVVTTVDAALSSVSVIDRTTLDRQQPRELADVLRGQPGVSVLSSGPYGKTTSVFLRGTGSAATVFLLDGVRIRSATTGATPWEFLPPSLLDRVEIVRGPRSSVYGADALGGVIQAFFPSGDRPTGGWVSLQGGSHATGEAVAGVSGRSADGGVTRYSLLARGFSTDGIRLRPDSERKGFDNAATALRIGRDFETGGEGGLVFLRSQGSSGFVEGETDYAIQVLGARLRQPLSEQLELRLSLSESRDEAETVTDFGPSRFDTRSRVLAADVSVFPGAHELLLGAEYLLDSVSSTTAYAESERDNRAVFAQLLLDLGRVSLEASLRHDDNEAFGGETTGALAAGIALDPRHRLRLSYGTAFRAPTFNDLYFPGFANPALLPETSASVEIGLRGRYDNSDWDLAVFQNRVDNLIAFDAARSMPGNVNEARIRGLELTLGTRFGDWELQAAATLQDPEDRRLGTRLARQVERSARLDVDRRHGSWDVGATLLLEGDRYNDLANSDRLDGYGRLDLRAGWRFADSWSLGLSVENALDESYAVTSFFDGTRYRTPGRSGFLRLRYGQP